MLGPIIKNEEDYEMVLVEVICFAISQGITIEDFLQGMIERWNEYSIVIKDTEATTKWLIEKCEQEDNEHRRME